MTCEERQRQLSLLMDAESAGLEPTGLFTHLEGCADCRHFFDSLIRFRGAVRRDREEILRQADEALPARPPLPAGTGARRSTTTRPGSWWRPALPAPAALALAVLLLVAGIAIGVGLSGRLGRAPAHAPDAGTAGQPAGEPTYIYVCALPQVEVTAAPEPAAGD